jgi:transcriptional regulator with XRE-family HTH domain
MGENETYVERARALLSRLVEVSGMSRREVKRRLGEQGSDTELARLLNGRLEPKLRHVVELCRVLGIHPLEFFRMVWKEPATRSPFLRRLDDLTGDRIQPSRRTLPASSLAADLDEVRRLVVKLSVEVEELKAERQPQPAHPSRALTNRDPRRRARQDP